MGNKTINKDKLLKHLKVSIKKKDVVNSFDFGYMLTLIVIKELIEIGYFDNE